MLSDILYAFRDDPHWEVPYRLGHWTYANKFYDEAKSQFGRSLEIIKGDINIKWEDKIKHSEDIIKKCDEN